MTIPVFDYIERFNIRQRGDVYYGPCPYDDLEDMTVSAVGRKVIIDDVVRTIKGVDQYSIFRGPRFNDPIGLLVENL